MQLQQQPRPGAALRAAARGSATVSSPCSSIGFCHQRRRLPTSAPTGRRAEEGKLLVRTTITTATTAEKKKVQQKREAADWAHHTQCPASSAGQTSPYGRAVLLQGFGWDSCCKSPSWYATVQSYIPAMRAAGVTHVWLPPPSQSLSPQGYLPNQLYNLNTRYGSQDQLVQLNAALKAAGIRPIADIVINHRCAEEKGPEGKYVKYRDDVNHKGRRINWGKWAIARDDPVFGGRCAGNPDTGEDYPAAPDLDHTNPELRAALQEWMEWLHEDIGFAGWRFDFVRGYGAQYVMEYVDATVGKDELCVGEYWADMSWSNGSLDYNQDAARQRICDWIDGNGARSGAYDFPTKGILQGKAPGLLGWWPSKSVTFVDNHDTGSTQQHWPFPRKHVEQGYAYILTHPGIPCVFWDHMFGWGAGLTATIGDLAALRCRTGLHSESHLDILAADQDMYVARIGNRVTLKLGPRYDMGSLLPREADGWRMALAGQDWAVWER